MESICKKKHSICKDPLNKPQGRENTEWSNTWYSKANEPVLNSKILLIGDSTGRKIRSTLERISGIPTDFFGTSAGLHDILFYSQLESFFEPVSWLYDTIFVWLGYHSLKNCHGEFYNNEDFEQFEEDVCNIIEYLKKYGRQIVLCSALFPVEKSDKISLLYKVWFHLKPFCRLFKEYFIEDESSIINNKNQILHKIALEQGLVFCDINNYMISLCKNYKTRCVHFDKIHYEGKAFPYMAKYFIQCGGLKEA